MDNFVPGFAFILILSADLANKVVVHEHKISFNAFVKHSLHHLYVDPIAWSSVIKVSKCAWACVETVTCFSFNVATQPDIKGLTLCELLPTDKYNASDKFKANSFYHQHSILVSWTDSFPNYRWFKWKGTATEKVMHGHFQDALIDIRLLWIEIAPWEWWRKSGEQSVDIS